MDTELQNNLAFFLTGRRAPGFAHVAPAMRPALFARVSDLSELRYDFPLVIAGDAAPESSLRSLSAMVDQAIIQKGEGAERDRLARHGHRIEAAVRRHLSARGAGDFATVWHTAATEIGLAESAMELWRSFKTDGDIVDADAALPARAIRAAWKAVQREKSRDFKARADRLLYGLHGILTAEEIGSTAGRSPERLRSAIGSSFAGAFDFDELSKILVRAKPDSTLADTRRQRIRELIQTIETQSFYRKDGYGFAFDNCAEAVRAYNERRGEAVRLLRAFAIAELEVAGDYRERVHDPLFENYGDGGLDPAEYGILPDYLICTDGGTIDAAETSRIVEVLAAGLPFKILVQTDDVLEPSVVAEGHVAFGLRARQIVDTAIGLTDVFVLQASAARLPANRDRLLSGLAYDGPALFSVFSGANGHVSGVPPYLVSAAATESRIFPTISFDPSAGSDWASRIDISDNPMSEDDWPVHRFAYEDANLQSCHENQAFTPADFAIFDERFARHFAVFDTASLPESAVTVAEAAADPANRDRVPQVALVTDDMRLRRALIDIRLLREVARCRSMWHSLQELAGIHNSHAERLLAEERKRAAVAVEPELPPVGAAPAPILAVSETEAVPAPSSDDPFIETPRCTSCNECTHVNPKMFVYNDNKQAYIADPDAGTYRQLVEAAEGCQVGIIHPGKPRNPNEPGLDDLVARAEAFK